MPNPKMPVPINRPITEDPDKIHNIAAAPMHIAILVNIMFFGDTYLKL